VCARASGFLRACVRMRAMFLSRRCVCYVLVVVGSAVVMVLAVVGLGVGLVAGSGKG